MSDRLKNGHSTVALPCEWRRDKIARLCELIGSGGTPPTGNPDFYNGGIPWVQTGDLKDDWLNETEKTITEEGLRNSAAQLYPKNTLLVAMYGATIGKLGILKFFAAVNQACCALVVRKTIDMRFMFYTLRSLRADLIAEALGGGQQNIGQETIKQTYVVHPPLPEQQRIAAYLDASCSAIDAAVTAERRQLEVLDAFKGSIIFHAVTKGLNPADPLKPSGVDWLGKVPAHWKLRRIKDIALLRSGDFIAAEDISVTGDYPVYGGNGIRGYTSAFNHNGKFSLIGRQGALCGNINYAEGKFWATEHAVVVSLPGWYDRLWFGELLRVMNLNQYSNAAAQPGLAVDRIKLVKLPVPPLKERIQISRYIESKLSEIKKTVTVIEAQIATLMAYRKSLIHECVTGQRRVTEADVNLVKANG
jgi:type I restriction enzyme S subunit